MNTNHLNRRSLMNTKLFKLITAGALTVLLSSCGDTVVDNDDSNPVQKKATLNVLVTDAVFGTPLEASVTLNTSGESKVTNAAGNFSFKNVSIGTHSVLVEVAGYASANFEAPIVANEYTANISIARDYTVDAKLYPRTASLQGLVYADNDGTVAPVPGATVRIELASLDGSEFLNKIITKTTGADGSFYFDSLPAVGGDYTLWVSDAAKKYRLKQGPTTPLKANVASVITNPIKFTSNDLNSFFELVSYPSVIAKGTDNLVFTFNNAIDFSKFTLNTSNSSVYLRNVANTASENPINGGILTRIPGANDSTLVLGLSGPSGFTVPRWPIGGFRVCFNDLKAIDGKGTGTAYCSAPIYVGDNNVKFELINHVARVDSLDTLRLEFSSAIDSAGFQPRWITFNPDNYAEKIVATGSNVITLIPIGKWVSNTSNGKFSITINPELLAANGERLGNSKTIEISLDEIDLSGKQVGMPNQIGTPDYNLLYNATATPLINYGAVVRWKKVSGASGYNIYGRASAGSKSDEFVFLKRVPNKDLYHNPDSMEVQIAHAVAANEGDYLINLATRTSDLGLSYEDKTLYALQDKNTLEIFVQAVNAISETSLAGSRNPLNVLVIKDIKSPSTTNSVVYNSAVPPAQPTYLNITTVTPTLIPAYWDLGTMLITEPTLTRAACVRFTEPMDTLAVLTQLLIEDGEGTVPGVIPAVNIASKLEITKKWVDAASIASSVNALKSGEDALCLILTTKVGNFFSYTAADGVSTATGTVNLRINIAGLKDKALVPNTFLIPEDTLGDGTSTSTLDIRFTASGIDLVP